MGKGKHLTNKKAGNEKGQLPLHSNKKKIKKKTLQISSKRKLKKKKKDLSAKLNLNTNFWSIQTYQIRGKQNSTTQT